MTTVIGNKWTNWNTGVHTGLIARWPGYVAEGNPTNALIQYADIESTFAGDQAMAQTIKDQTPSDKFVYLLAKNDDENPNGRVTIEALVNLGEEGTLATIIPHKKEGRITKFVANLEAKLLAITYTWSYDQWIEVFDLSGNRKKEFQLPKCANVQSMAWQDRGAGQTPLLSANVHNCLGVGGNIEFDISATGGGYIHHGNKSTFDNIEGAYSQMFFRGQFHHVDILPLETKDENKALDDWRATQS